MARNRAIESWESESCKNCFLFWFISIFQLEILTMKEVWFLPSRYQLFWSQLWRVLYWYTFLFDPNIRTLTVRKFNEFHRFWFVLAFELLLLPSQKFGVLRQIVNGNLYSCDKKLDWRIVWSDPCIRILKVQTSERNVNCFDLSLCLNSLFRVTTTLTSLEFSTGKLTVSEKDLIHNEIFLILASEPLLSDEADVLIDCFISPFKLASFRYYRLYFFQQHSIRKLWNCAGRFNAKVVHFLLIYNPDKSTIPTFDITFHSNRDSKTYFSPWLLKCFCFTTVSIDCLCLRRWILMKKSFALRLPSEH